MQKIKFSIINYGKSFIETTCYFIEHQTFLLL